MHCSLAHGPRPHRSMWATSEEQLTIHMLGKRHSRMLALQAARAGCSQRGSSGGPSAVAAAGPPFAAQQQILSPHGAAMYLPAGAAVPVPVAGPGGVPMVATPVYLTPLGSAPGGVPAVAAAAAAAAQAQEGGRLPRCDLCNVVTPSERHFSYHLQSERHMRRQQRARGGAGGGGGDAGEGEGAAGSSAAALSSATGAGRTRSVSPAHRRRGSGDGWGSGGSECGTGGSQGERAEPRRSCRLLACSLSLHPPAPTPRPRPSIPLSLKAALCPPPPPHPPHAAGGGEATQGGGLACRVCGIMATSELNLEDHYRGRRHQRNLQRLAQQGVPVLPAEAAAGVRGRGGGPPPDGATTVATVSVGGLQKQARGRTGRGPLLKLYECLPRAQLESACA